MAGAARASRLRWISTTVWAAWLGLTLAAPSTQMGDEQPRRPVVGILSSPLKLPGAFGFGNISWVWATYVDSLHSAGADVVPLDVSCPVEVLREKLEEVDAVLLTGGSDDAGVHGSAYPDRMMQHIQTIFKRATSFEPESATGDFPLWATCQGFQAVCVLAANDPGVVVRTFGTEFVKLPLNLTEAAATSNLLGSAPAAILDELTGLQATLNFHNFGVLASSFRSGSQPHVHGFRLLATDQDQHGQTFAAMMEHERLPIYGTQFHPEMYHWLDKGSTSLGQEINRANEYLMRQFVDRARDAMFKQRPLRVAKLVKWYNRLQVPISVLGDGFIRRFPGRALDGYIFESTRPMGRTELNVRLAAAAAAAATSAAASASTLAAKTGDEGIIAGGAPAVVDVQGMLPILLSSACAFLILSSLLVVVYQRLRSFAAPRDLAERLIAVA
eukprot:TRINITY_DN12653_c0_g3_i1.p1 TRINITY_DN12653_c0_g3~~TRINITY_DN12653_c0_g3_i1.p1  ORF type:complete len:484 (-),score=93.48 TRINITY_DN12653_c0_g3_i1:561-1889(-)